MVEDQGLADLYVEMRTLTVTRAEFEAVAPAPIKHLLAEQAGLGLLGVLRGR